LDIEGIEILRNAGYKNLAVADVEQLAHENPFGSIDFDVIVAGEILEHLSNPGYFLDNIRVLLRRPTSKLLLTTVNAYCAYRFVFTLLVGRENVHQDHVAYYSRSTLLKLLTRHGYEIDDFRFYPVGREHEKTLKRGRYWILWLADRLAYWFNPALADGVMVTCRIRN
jgi:hypothetical protein